MSVGHPGDFGRGSGASGFTTQSDDRTEKPIEERRRVVGRELFTQLDRLRNHRRIRGIRMQDLKRTEAGENTVHPRHPGQCPAFRKAISQDRVKADLGGCHTTDQISRERPHWVGEDTWTRCEDFERIEMRAGTIVAVDDFPKARKPLYRLTIDFGPYGRARDRAVEAALDVPLARTGSPYAVAPGRVTKDDGTAYRVFTPFWKAWTRHGWRAPAPAPGREASMPLNMVKVLYAPAWLSC